MHEGVAYWSGLREVEVINLMKNVIVNVAVTSDPAPREPVNVLLGGDRIIMCESPFLTFWSRRRAKIAIFLADEEKPEIHEIFPGKYLRPLEDLEYGDEEGET